QIRCNEISMDQKPGAARARTPQFLEDDHVEEVVETHAAVFLGHGAAQQALGASLQPQFPRHDAVLFPLCMKRHNLTFDEAPDRFPENMMFLAENGSLDHRLPSLPI